MPLTGAELDALRHDCGEGCSKKVKAPKAEIHNAIHSEGQAHNDAQKGLI